MKKFSKIVGFTLLGILAIVLIFFGSIFVVNKVQLKSEAKKIELYGEAFKIDGENMRYQISGKGDKTIVLLTGYMTASPVIDFKPLTEELEKNYQVITIEPFGYGLSDDTDKERTVENITKETHSLLASLGIDRYVLMGHSLAGMYSLDYINEYPNEVEAFIGIDSTLPSQGGADDNQQDTIKLLSQSGLFRLFSKASPEMLNLPPVSSDLQKQYTYLSLKNIGSTATYNEAVAMPENFKKTASIKYPKDLPVLFLLATESTEPDPSWVTIHQDMIKESTKGQVDIIEGSHYLHHTKAKEIAEKTNNFLK